MRIAQIMLGKGFGGAERSFVDTALSLAERGHEVMAICHERFSEIERLRGVENLDLETVNAHGEWDFWTPRRIARLLKGFRADVVHTQLKRAAWHGGRAAKLAGVPIVSKLHNYVNLKRYRNVDKLLCTTEDQRRHVLEQGWPETGVTVIPNFSCLLPVDRVAERCNGPVTFLSYGRYVKKKGFDLLIRAFKQVLDTGIDARLRIGGRGPELESLRALADELGITKQVQLGEWLSDVSEALDAADCFVLSSLDEPFGIVMLEAMARGVPIVSSRTKGPMEVLNDDSASLCAVGSADGLAAQMKTIVDDSPSAQARAEAALEIYRKLYFVDSVIPRIETVYSELSS